MSTNPKELNPAKASEELIAKSKKTIDRSVRTLVQEMEHENTLMAESPSGIVQRVLKVYRGIKPLLTLLNSLPILPMNWRASLGMLIHALDALRPATHRFEVQSHRSSCFSS